MKNTKDTANLSQTVKESSVWKNRLRLSAFRSGNFLRSRGFRTEWW
ncbi:hypothetical protein [Pontibacter sp. BAB1700]|nr:hypothetical protein [Pontibacter sp. BAB1700]